MPRKRRADRPVFADIVREEQARPAADPLDGRAVDRVGGRDLWDDAGRHWSLRGEIAPGEVEALVRDPSVRLGTAWAGERRLEWMPAPAHREHWFSRFRPAVRPHGAGIPDDGGLAYYPQVWTRVTGERLLLLQTIC